ncbi:FkbM family methyltransferase [Brachyspira sp. SAP_772]|uniref:FkbM family methyltransferase n=1 Tax=Brachyspira sp. SAP_772 TaxID=2608385 RepID=UPI0012F48F49|nr:FkbM family methyltransferase [Brachyspira sp. SAP_772]
MSISNDLLNDCRKKLGNKFTKEFIKEKENSDNFINALINTDNFDIFYNMLEEDYSKNIFRKVVLYRYMLAFNPKVHKNLLKEILFSFKYGIISTFKWIIKMISFLITKRFKLPKEIGAWALYYIFYLEQYNVRDVFEVNGDNVLFDVGAWKGDSSYFFSKRSSNNAKIYAFEPDNNAYNVLKNIKDKYNLNNVILQNEILLDCEKDIDFVSMIPNTPTVKKHAITLDMFVEKNNIENIDYIKMDVEGAEQKILEGAVNTIKKYRPSLAIAIYHGGELFMEDFFKIPVFIKSIADDYEYYIRSYSPRGGETILFCKPKE